MSRSILIALDSVGIDPLGHGRDESVYSRSRFLFPRSTGAGALSLRNTPLPGILIETTVADEHACGAIECAITYTSIFSGRSALDQHGLMNGLGLKESTLRDMVQRDNLFHRFQSPCLANAIFPLHLAFLGSSFVQESIPNIDRKTAEGNLRMDGQPISLKGAGKVGFAELFTLGEINQNIFIYAAQQANVPLRTWDDVRKGAALTGTLTHELEGRFNWDALGVTPLPLRAPVEAGQILARLSRQHDFTFYKYQLADLVSHTGQVELARAVFDIIETFIATLLNELAGEDVSVIVTSDHGHLEQVAYTHGHPKSKVPTWYFGRDAENQVKRLQRPEGIYHVLCNP